MMRTFEHILLCPVIFGLAADPCAAARIGDHAPARLNLQNQSLFAQQAFALASGTSRRGPWRAAPVHLTKLTVERAENAATERTRPLVAATLRVIGLSWGLSEGLVERVVNQTRVHVRFTPFNSFLDRKSVV